MTAPFERTRALLLTKEMLQRLANPQNVQNIPIQLREEAVALLRHYPTYSDIELAHKALPETFGPVPPFSRMTGSQTVRGVIDGSSDGFKASIDV